MKRKYTNKATNEQKKSKEFEKFEQVFSIDESDKKIIRTLSQDCRLSYREIARRTRLSIGTVIDRIRKLKMNGILRGFFIDIDAKKIGFGLTAVIEVTTERGVFLDVADEISKFPNIYGVYDIAGPFDTVVIGKFTDPDELNEFLQILQSQKFVTKTVTHVVLKTVKEDFRVRV